MKCRACEHRETDFLTTYDSRGLIEFSYCNCNIARSRQVDPDVERECDSFTEKVESMEARNAT